MPARRAKPIEPDESDAPRSKRKAPPHPFILEALAPLSPEVRPMFSGYSVYVGDKIVCMLRDSPKAPHDNGVWLVFSEAADLTSPALRSEFPSLRAIALLDGKIGHWLLLPSDSPGFEAEALHACDLLLRRDPRFGRIPQSRLATAKKKRQSGASARSR